MAVVTTFAVAAVLGSTLAGRYFIVSLLAVLACR